MSDKWKQTLRMFDLSILYGLISFNLHFSCRTTAFVQSTISNKLPALDNATRLVLNFQMPSYIVYEYYNSTGSRPPDDVTESRDGDFVFVTMKVKPRK